ncbi:MAG: hypothetical protein ABIY55_14990 [Kofleriaceae bacterium]
MSGDFARVLDRLVPWRRLRLRLLDVDAAGLAACARMSNVIELAVARLNRDLPRLPALEASQLLHCDPLPALPRVRRLALLGDGDGDAVVRTLAADPALAAVEELNVAMSCSTDSVAALAASPHARGLRRLAIRALRFDDAAVLAPVLPQLATLEVSSLGDALDLSRVLGPRLAILGCSSAGEAVARRLADGPFPSLGRVMVGPGQRGSATIAERWPQLWLDLGDPEHA